MRKNIGKPLKYRRIKKDCPRCGGNLFYFADHEGEYDQCLQCGFTKYPNISSLPELEEELVGSRSIGKMVPQPPVHS